MGNKIFLSAIFFFIVVFLLAMYWFFPFGEVSFETRVEHSNFNLNASNSGEMQFYENLRYPSSKISYKIEDCPLNKKGDMEEAFLLLEEKTILDFYPVNSNPEISVFCDSHNRIEGGMFIAGGGGPSNITQTDNFNVIKNGIFHQRSHVYFARILAANSGILEIYFRRVINFFVPGCRIIV